MALMLSREESQDKWKETNIPDNEDQVDEEASLVIELNNSNHNDCFNDEDF